MTRWLAPLAAAALIAAPVVAADPPPAKLAVYHVPYRLTDTKHVLVRAKLNGKGPFNFILDTGAPAVFIPEKVASRVGVKLDAKGWGAFDRFEVEGGPVVDKARTRVEDLFQLEGMNGMGLAGVELHGVIGYNVLARYRITYDFTADKLVWVPLDFDPPAVRAIGGGGQGGLEILGPVMKMLAAFMGVKPDFDVKPRGFLGFEVESDSDGLVVKSVLSGGPAAEAGLQAGDRIEAVGVTKAGRGRGKPRMEDVAGKDLAKLLDAARPGDEASVQVRRGGKSETVVVPLGKGL